MPTTQSAPANYAFWPPTQLRIGHAAPMGPDMDEDPLKFFLSPTAPNAHPVPTAMAPMDDDADDIIFDFDAGIEDPKNPRRTVIQNVSPSTLSCLRRAAAAARNVSSWSSASSLSTSASDTDSDIGGATDSDDLDLDLEDNDDDKEYYVRFVPHHAVGMPVNLDDFTIDGVKPKMRARRGHMRRNAVSSRGPARPMSAPSSLSSSLSSSPFAGSGALPIPSRGRELFSRRRQQQLWREPSPDVWSISEEAEEDIISREIEVVEVADMVVVDGKLQKKVRFMLPAREN